MSIGQARHFATGHMKQQQEMSSMAMVQQGLMDREGAEFNCRMRPSPSGNRNGSKKSSNKSTVSFLAI